MPAMSALPESVATPAAEAERLATRLRHLVGKAITDLDMTLFLYLTVTIKHLQNYLPKLKIQLATEGKPYANL